MKGQITKRFLPLLLVFAMLLGFVPLTSAASIDQTLSFAPVDRGSVQAEAIMHSAAHSSPQEAYNATDIVRVSIVLDGASTIEAGYSTQAIAQNAAAMSYRSALKRDQVSTTAQIEATLGQKLDVVWNLTLAANLISANVAYSQIGEIENVPGVKEVVLEQRYSPAVYSTDEPNNPQMATSFEMIGSANAWASGYTGAGSRVAVIDTGIDTDHQSFSDSAFQYSLAYQAELTDKDAESYISGLNLLNAEEIAAVAGELNVPGVFDANELYVNSKIPFAFNYVDGDTDITHDNDSQGEHGSHVESIVSANAFIANEDGTFSRALETVKVQGVAPDSQIIVMKVFGKRGGAYDSDYMAAIEDAIVLGCDAVNLSLGTSSPGFSRSMSYEKTMDLIVSSDTLVTVSMGNAGGWADYAKSGVPYLYADDVNMLTGGSPASYTNGLSVASVDNAGYTGQYLSVGEDLIFYNQEFGYGNEDIMTLAGEREYILIDGIGTEEEWAALGDVVAGKVAVCSRGSTSFFEKANAAVSNGAIAVIVYNNEPGQLLMDLTGYSYSAPCISITQDEADMLRRHATAMTTDHLQYYAGKLTVATDIASSYTEPAYFVMSSFSSYGIPGTLELKPEITAPGGSIYGVNGLDPSGTAYETMSGTSMASPQVAGMAALVGQYIRENGLEEKTGLSVRHLTQSLLMATAVPLFEEASGGKYWSILKQGAGLANVSAALSAKSYIKMHESATSVYDDYKVKVELGDDPQREGFYTFDFSIHNFSDDVAHYTLHSDFFTQGILSHDNGERYLDTYTTDLPIDARYIVDGDEFVPTSHLFCDLDDDGDTDADDGQIILNYTVGLIEEIGAEADVDDDGKITTHDAHLIFNSLVTPGITVEPGKAVTVQVELVIPNQVKSMLDANYVNGAYIEGFVYVEPTITADGAMEDATYSIPILGYYGNWSDSSMYDKVSATEYLYGEPTAPYVSCTNNLVIKYPGDPTPYYHIGNPYIIEETIPTERFAIKSSDIVYGYEYTLIRNAAAVLTVVTDEDGNILFQTPVNTQVCSAYFDESYGEWRNYYYSSVINRTPDALKLEQDDVFTVTVMAVPEKYENGANMTSEEILALQRDHILGDGAYLQTTLTVDDEAPVVTGITKDILTGNLTITARDNNYIAAIQVVNHAGSKLFGSALPAASEKGQTTETTINLSGAVIGPECLVVVADYADNYTVYEVAYGGEPEDYTGRMFGFTAAYARDSGPRWVELRPDEIWYNSTDAVGGGMETAARTSNHYTAAEYVNGRVFAASADGYFYTMVHGEWTDEQKVGRFSSTVETIMDMAFNSQDGKLYVLGSDNVLYTLDTITGALENIAEISISHPDPYNSGPHYLQTLAIDDSGNFYTANYGGTSSAYLFRFSLDDIIDDAIIDLAPVNPDSPLGLWSYSNESMAWDHNQGILYMTSAWGSYPSMDLDNKLWIVDTKTGEARRSNETFAGDYEPDRFAGMLFDQVVGLYVVPAGNQTQTPTDTAIGLELNATERTMLKGGKEILIADVYPWTLSDKSVTWESSNTDVAIVDNGIVTAVGVGSVTITATTNAEPKLSASCQITVEKVPTIKLSGLIREATGAATWAEFTTDSPANYTAMGSGSSYVAGGLLNDRIFVHDGESMYGIDGDTFAASDFGEISPTWAWSDAAPAPAGEDGLFNNLIAICADGTYVEMIDPDAGTLTHWDQSSSFASDPMAVIAHAGTGTYDYDLWFEYYPNCPANFYYMMTESGALWYLTIFTATDGDSYNIATQYLGDTGISLSGVSKRSGSFGSLLYDQDTKYLILSRYQGGETANLFAIDPERMLVADLGNFGSDIYPVVSLYQYDRVTELTLRMSEEEAAFYMGDTLQLSVQTKPSSFTGGVTWSSSNEAVATVDENGLVSSVSVGDTIITATSVDVNSAGEKVSVTSHVTVLPLLSLDATVNAQIETDEGLTWSSIDLRDRTITTIANATTKLTGAGYSNGKIYGSDGDYEHQCNYYEIDPSNGFAETKGTASHASYAILDGTNSPALEVDLYGTKATAFGEMLFLSDGGRLSMLNFEEGTALGWTISYYDIDEPGAIAFMGHTVDEYGTTAYHFAVLTIEGDLYQLAISPSYYDTWSERVEYALNVSVLGNIGHEFTSPRTLSMACVRNAHGLDGLVISDASQESAVLYYVDLSDESLSCGKIGNLDGVSHISGLYGNMDTVLDISEDTVLDAARYAIREATASVNSTPLPLGSEPITHDGAEEFTARATENTSTAAGHKAISLPDHSQSTAAHPQKVSAVAADGIATLTLSEPMETTNGLISVTYDPRILTFESMDAPTVNSAIRADEEKGTITFGYAAGMPLTANEVVAELHFSYSDQYINTLIWVETHQRGENVSITGEIEELCLEQEDGDHVYAVTQRVEPTCFKDGYELLTCTNCGQTTSTVLPANSDHCPSATFSDLVSTHWYHESVDYVLHQGLMHGVGEGKFLPNGVTTRAQIVTVLYRLAGNPETEIAGVFTDVSADAWYTEAVEWAYANNITKGISDTLFAPNQPVTREQAVTFLYRYAKLLGNEVSSSGDLSGYTDSSAVSSYAVEAVAWAVEQGIIIGLEDGKLSPTDTTTRAQTATILMRFCQ